MARQHWCQAHADHHLHDTYSAHFVGTKRIVGRLIASQRALASAASFLPRFTNHEVPIMRRNAA
jgi:hypothetical protein